MEYLPGTEVSARGLRWEVVHSHPAGDQQLYRLRGLDGALKGHEYDVLHPFEAITPVSRELRFDKPAPLAHFRLYQQAFLLEQALGSSALLAAQPGRLKIAPYQLVPVMRALRMSRPRLLLADAVGLGKTIQAGIVIAELLARRRAHRILIVSPAGPLLQQWRLEMRDRFGLRFRVLDSDVLQQIRYETELGANPFDKDALALISIDFAKQERVLQDLERSHYDIVVIDEAHHCARLGNAGDREDTLRRRLAEVLARKSDALLLLSATPHDGYDPHFSSLVELLDPSLVDGKGQLRGEGYTRHLVRRLKRHVRDPETGEPMFQERLIEPVLVRFAPTTGPAFAAMQRGLLALVAPQLRRAMRNRRYSDALAFVSLLKRSVSTAAACRSTLLTISERLELLANAGVESQDSRKQRLRTLRDYRRRIERFGVLSVEEERDQAALEAEDIAAELAEEDASALFERLDLLRKEMKREGRKVRQTKSMHAAVAELAELAELAVPEDPKLAGVRTLLREIRSKEPTANVLVYTEYVDSQTALVDHLLAAKSRGELTGEVLTISGEDSEKDRIKVTERFRRESNLVLVSTDATAEGLNLHDRCHHLIHLELPYNPNRLEQRNGRIDRFGQKETPQIKYLYLAGTFEERLLLRLVSKYEKQRSRLTFMPNTLGVFAKEDGTSTVKLLEGLVDEEAKLFEVEPSLEFRSGDEDDTSSAAYQELLREVERSYQGFEKAAKTHAWFLDVDVEADQRDLFAAGAARNEGRTLAGADLNQFVLDAVRSESGDPASVAAVGKEIWSLKLDGGWTYGLDEIPGWDSEARTLLLTTDLERVEDEQGRRLGFLGRAHPIVRRALDRVRNIQFGTQADFFDRRVSVGRSSNGRPTVLLTYVGQIYTPVGRVFERVLAVRLEREGRAEVLIQPAEWLDDLKPENALPAREPWKTHFIDWVPLRREVADARVREVFRKLSDTFLQEHHRVLDEEQNGLDDWLKLRAKELCGAPTRPSQADLFQAQQEESVSGWRRGGPAQERLASFALDPSQEPKLRREADGVLSLFTRRRELLSKLKHSSAPVVHATGMLMLVPGSGA